MTPTRNYSPTWDMMTFTGLRHGDVRRRADWEAVARPFGGKTLTLMGTELVCSNFGRWHIVGYSAFLGYQSWTAICGALAPSRRHEVFRCEVDDLDVLCGNCRRIAGIPRETA